MLYVLLKTSTDIAQVPVFTFWRDTNQYFTKFSLEHINKDSYKGDISIVSWSPWLHCSATMQQGVVMAIILTQKAVCRSAP